jgi:negative regulator of sigma-B (phosphoserine phosphatase)
MGTNVAQTRTTLPAHRAVDWAVSARALAGENVSGDLDVVLDRESGVLVVAMDGAGHGAEAAAAVNAAAEVLANIRDNAVTDIIVKCHEAMRRTRGAAISLAAFDTAASTMTWIGVGNVEGVLFRAAGPGGRQRESLLLRGGVVGFRLPPLRAARIPIAAGDTLVFATDGVSGRFSHTPPPNWPVGDIAADILGRHGKETDDALVVVARYMGPRP